MAVSVAAQMYMPYVIKNLTKVFVHPDWTQSDGFFWAGILALLGFLRAITMSLVFVNASRILVRIRATIMYIVYKKALKVSLYSKQVLILILIFHFFIFYFFFVSFVPWIGFVLYVFWFFFLQ